MFRKLYIGLATYVFKIMVIVVEYEKIKRKSLHPQVALCFRIEQTCR